MLRHDQGGVAFYLSLPSISPYPPPPWHICPEEQVELGAVRGTARLSSESSTVRRKLRWSDSSLSMGLNLASWAHGTSHRDFFSWLREPLSLCPVFSAMCRFHV